MRKLMSFVAFAVVAALMGCCHDTCDTCRDICSSCGNGSHATVHAAPAGAQVMPAPVPAK